MIRRYHRSDEKEWNSFVSASTNATFIHNRRFMDYHKDRFTDHSLLLFKEEKLIAVFPANQQGGTIFSHGGLTYGGLIVGPNMKLMATISCFQALMKYYWKRSFKKILYKPVPSFFHERPYVADLYPLFLVNAKLVAMNTGFVADLTHGPIISSRRMRMVRKAQKNNVRVVKAPDCTDFWKDILVPHLAEKFHTKPVHTIGEIELLRKRFPTHILQYNAVSGSEIVAGVTIFLDRKVAHTQYIASSPLGRNIGALDFLFWRLMKKEFKHCQSFSFGTTNMGSADGRALAQGLVEWKEHFGTAMVPYPCYDIETKNYPTLTQYI